MIALGRKRPDCLPFREINDLDQPGIGHIDKSPCATWFDLKAFRMRSEWNIRKFCTRSWINNRKRALAIADQHLAALRIDADIIRIVAQIDATQQREIIGAHEAYRPVSRIGDIERIGRVLLADALRLLEAAHRADQFPVCNVDHADTVVAEFRDGPPLPLEIDGEVIDSAAYGTKRDLGLQLQWGDRRLCLRHERA